MTRRRFALRWYRCKCKRAKVGVSHTEIVARIRCVDGRCGGCGESMADFRFYRTVPTARAVGSLTWMQARAARS